MVRRQLISIGFCVVFSVAGLLKARAQQLQKPRPVTLRCIITIDGDAEKARRATIELTDELGEGSARAVTDQNGEAVFQTMSGAYRIRVTGPGIRPYEGEVEMAPVESTHLERIRVRRDPGSIPNTMNETVPAVRLRIPDSARKLFEKGSQSLKKEKWGDGRTVFQKAIAEYSDYDMAYNGLGICEMHLSNADAAKQAFSRAIALNPKYAEAQRNLARVFIGEHNNAEALPLLKASVESDPTDVWALSNAAYLLLQAHQFEPAFAYAEKVHTLPHQGMANAHMIAAYAAEAMGKDDVARKELNVYLEEDPKGPNAARARQELNHLSAASK